jgi:hypothetical protein
MRKKLSSVAGPSSVARALWMVTPSGARRQNSGSLMVLVEGRMSPIFARQP